MGIRTNLGDAWDGIRGRRERANPIGGALFDKMAKSWGTGDAWAKSTYGEYYATSVSVYSAIKLRQEAIARVPLRVHLETADGLEQVDPQHPLQQLLDKVNRWWTRGDLWRATETYLSLWGSAYWALVREGTTITEIWPLRPDKMKVLPDEQEYIKGFVYGSGAERRAFAPDEVVWFRYFNPLDEYSGLSPIAPVRLSVDMGVDALKANRFALANDTTPGMIISVNDTPTDEEVLSFYQRWEQRFMGPSKSRRPAILGEGMTASNLGFSPKDMMALESMRWSVEDVARTFNVPMPMLHDLSRATYSNIETARKSFWEDCISLQLRFYEEELTEMLLPLYGDEGLVVRFDTSGVEALQEDEDARAGRREKYVKSGIMTINEVRGEMGMEAVEWGDGDPRPTGPAGVPAMSITDGSASTRGVEWEAKGRAVDDDLRRKNQRIEATFAKELSELLGRQADDFIKKYEVEAKTLRTKISDATSNGAVVEGVAPIALDREVHQDGSPVAVATSVKALAWGMSLDKGYRSTIFNPTEWMPQFTALIRKHLTTGVISGAETQVDKYKLGISFDITAPHIKGWISNRSKWWATNINDGTEKKLFKVLSDGRKQGLGTDKIANNLRKLKKFQTEVRSQRVARTEMTVASGQGSLESFAQAEVPAKRWYTAMDERVRETHMSAHGQVRRRGEQFSIGFDSMEAPGQGGDPAENVNCRCVVLPEGITEK